MPAAVQHPEFQAVERALAGQRLATVLALVALLAQHVGPPARRRQQPVEPQPVVVVDVFIPQGDAVDALAQHHRQFVLHEAGVAPVIETSGQLLAEPPAPLDLPQQQHPAVAGEEPAGKIR